MQLPKVKAVLYKSKTHKDGTHPILIRITHQRKVTYKSIGHSVLPEAWDNDSGRVYEKKPVITKRQEGQLNFKKLCELKNHYTNAIILSNARHINNSIDDTIAEINTINQKLKVNEESLDVSNIRKKLSPQKSDIKSVSFLSFGRYRQEKLLRAGAINNYKQYKSVLDKLAAYTKGKDILFTQVDADFLQDYETHLQTKGYQVQNVQKYYRVNTIHNNLKTLRAIYYSAIKEKIISGEKNPFFLFSLKQEANGKKLKLSLEEIIAIENLALENNSLLWHVRNYFLFSFYCAGIRVSDLLQLRWANITQGRVEYKMVKTGGFKSISLLPKAQNILAQYKHSKSRKQDYIFPLLNTEMELTKPSVLQNQISAKTALINKYLKKLAVKTGIEKPLSTHIARHSFSDIARKRGVNLYDISKLLGHSSIKMTEAYLASLDVESQDEAHKSILNY